MFEREAADKLWRVGVECGGYQVRRTALIVVGGVVVAGVLFVGWVLMSVIGFWDTYSWNQKLTVTVETPDGERSGSAITHVEVRLLRPGSKSLSAASAEEQSTGEAVVVPLPGGQYLFVLRAENPSALPQGAFRDAVWAGAEDTRRTRDFFIKMLQMSDLSGSVLRDAYPRFVTFDDLNDPTSVKLVDPDDLAATFGPGYTLKSVTLEITDEPVKFGKVEEALDWWETPPDFIGGDPKNREYGEPLYDIGKWSFVKRP